MNKQTLLQINSSGRYEGSITRQVSALLITYLKQQSSTLELSQRDLASGLPFVNEAWINANFTAVDERNLDQKEVLRFSDELVSELENAQQVVIASPIYNFNIPAVLKAWIDMVARIGRTFRYSENGPKGLLNDKKVFLVMASGGVPIGSEMDIASIYLKQVLGFIGMTDVSVIDATKVTCSNVNLEDSLKSLEGVLNA